MRIRQVRPEFFTDAVTAHLPPAVQVTYIGLWCVADDAGWLSWDVAQIGALLYPYMSVHVRERAVAHAGETLVAAGRMELHDCGCAHIPTLPDHQRIGGNKSFPARDSHRVHTNMGLYARNVTLGNGMVVDGMDSGKNGKSDVPLSELVTAEALVAAGRKP